MMFRRYQYSKSGAFRRHLRTGAVEAYDWFYGGCWFVWPYDTEGIRW